ncbi:MAG TPA: hypothetical protein PK011_14950, partial [Marinagarivorans sp.]|nr:hypothetical protein [Marinagarivorans sp.]
KLSGKLMIFLVVVIAVWVRQACASSVVTAKIVNFGVYGYGNIQLELDTLIDQSNCAMKYIELPSGSPIANHVMSIAALAFATGNRIQVVTDSCYNGVPSLSAGRSSYILLIK